MNTKNKLIEKLEELVEHVCGTDPKWCHTCEDMLSEISDLKKQIEQEQKEVKTMEQILAKYSCIDLLELQFKNEVQIIRPSEAFEAMEEYHARFSSEQETDEEIEVWAYKGEPYSPAYMKGLAEGAKAHRDGKIIKTK